MKICYFGTYRENYSRNKIMISALQSAGIEVIECHVKLWHGIDDRINATISGWRRPGFWWRLVQSYIKLGWMYIKIKDFDVIVVGYPGHLDVFLAKMFAILWKKPLVWDVFMSIYLIALERGLDQKSKIGVGLIKYIERLALRLPDLLIQDTKEYVEWFNQTHGVSESRFRMIPTGADDRLFHPPTLKDTQRSDQFNVLYYGTFIPNHGVLKIIEAAAGLIEFPNILFTFIGEGPEKEQAELLSTTKNLKNVRFLGWMAQDTLLSQIQTADVCLGAFGDTPQSLMTVQNKIFECLAMGKAVVTGDSPAIRSSLPSNAILVSDRQNPLDLSEKILFLKENPKVLFEIADHAKQTYYSFFSIEHIGTKLRTYLKELT